jgi:hypothetical protein
MFSTSGTAAMTTPNDSFLVEVWQSTRQITVAFSQIFPFPRYLVVCLPKTVNHLIQQIPKSLKHLVENIKVLVTEEEITRCLNLQKPILLASNGGAILGRASYGWILQIGTTQIDKGKGPTYGNNPRSFRAEGYGMASALLYLHLLERQIEFVHDDHSTNTIICA